MCHVNICSHYLTIGIKQTDCCRTNAVLSSPPTNEEVNAFDRFVRLLVCLSARLLKNASMDLDEMLHVDRCRDMDELINL